MSEDPHVLWMQADTFAIETDPSKQAWNAGHVNDICSIGNDEILAATDTGGVWHIIPRSDPGASRFHFAIPLSQDWNNPDMTCLAFGPDDPQHIYAGCGLPYDDHNQSISDRLYETNPLVHEPLHEWNSIVVPFDTGVIYRIGVFKALRRIVLACDGGVYWASIPSWTPPAPSSISTPRTYTWHKAQNSNSGTTGLAMGPNDTVVVAVPGQGIFFGEWSSTSTSTDLVLQRATLLGVSLTRMARTSLASCTSNLARMYAVCAAPQDANKYEPISMLLSSNDGGRTWAMSTPTMVDTTKTLSDTAGSQGSYNNCIAISPLNPATVVIGWQNGTFLSNDSGQTWSLFQGDPGLHHDVHALYFDTPSSNQVRLYIGSDGGIVMTPDLGGSFVSSYNQRLLNLQCMSPLERNFWGTFSASPVLANLVGTGLQDNGTVYTLLGESLLAETPWRSVEGGDGTLALFLQTGQFIHSDVGSVGGPVSISNWNDASRSFGTSSVVPIISHGSSSPGGLLDPSVGIVTAPQWRNSSKQLLYAIAGDKGPIYGLFAEDNGDNAHWDYVGDVFPRPLDQAPSPSLPSGVVWSLESRTGSTIFIGTTGGRIFALNPANFQVRELPIQQKNTDALPTRIVVVSDSLAFAAYNTSTTGTILRWNGEQWEDLAGSGKSSGLPQERIYSLAVTDQQELFAATDNRVYISRDQGATWNSASMGLPNRPHSAELRFVKPATGGSTLYLSTFGRSVWKATLDEGGNGATSKPFQNLPKYMGWNTLIGSRADGRLYQLLGGGVKPVPPIDPELQRRMQGAYQTLVQGAATLQVLEATMQKQFAASHVDAQITTQFQQASQRVIQGMVTLQALGTTMEKPFSTAKLEEQFAKSTSVQQLGIRLQQATRSVTQGAATLQALGPEVSKQLETAHLDLQFNTQLQGAFQQVVQGTNVLQTLESEVGKQPGG